MSLPESFRRAWARTELVLDGEVDRDAARVAWIQATDVFVDVRGDGMAFAGVATYRSGTMTWRHLLDVDDVDRVDRARVQFDDGVLVEVGTNLFGARVYRERWEAMPGDGGDVVERVEPHLVAVRRGDHAAAVVDRRADGGPFAACYWARVDDTWHPTITVGDVDDLPRPDSDLFPLDPVVVAEGPLVDRLRGAIVHGRYRPGARLTEEQLANDFGVSRSPVREALRALAAEGFVRSGPHAGTFVADLGDDEVEDLLELRRSIESLVARRAAERRRPEHVHDLHDTIEAAFRSLARADYDALVELNGRFHAGLAAASGNPALQRLLDQLRNTIAWVYGGDVRDRAPASWAEHRAVLDAVKAGDGDDAAAAALAHVDAAAGAFRRRHVSIRH